MGMLWPLSALGAIVMAKIQGSGILGFQIAVLEAAATEFCKSMTFMPCIVLMQLCTPQGCESTAFTLMQWSGTVGQVLSRNIEYGLLGWFGVLPKQQFANFWMVTVVAAGWRVGTAVFLCKASIPRLQRFSQVLEQKKG